MVNVDKGNGDQDTDENKPVKRDGINAEFKK